MNMKDLGMMMAVSFVHDRCEEGTPVSVQDLVKDAFLSGFNLLAEKYFTEKLSNEALIHFMQSRELKGEYEEWFNEQKLDDWRNVRESIVGEVL